MADPGLLRFIEEATGSRPAEWPPQSPDLEALSWAAFYFHPSLEVARAQWAVARASIKTASARPNPTLSAQPGYNFSASGGASPWIPGVNIDWPIETAGKRGHRMSRARQLAESARWNIHQSAWQARAALRVALLDYTAAEQRASLLRRQLDAANSLNEVLSQRLQAGAISSLEASPFQLAYIKATGDLADARRQASDARARVAEAIGLPLRSLDGLTLRMDLGATPATDKESTAADLHRIALQNRADVRSLLADYAASESALQLEIARQYPDARLGNGYQWDQWDSKWTLGLTLEIPVLHRNQGLIAESRAKRDEIAARFNALQSRVISEVDRADAAYRASLDQLGRSADLLSAHARQLGSLRSAFAAGAADQVELRTAEVEAAAAELTRLDAQTRAQQALGDLQQALQHPFANPSLVEKSPREFETQSTKP
ncbi:MAG: TolC family protein [Verrucomicrobia bacterium]|nr:TolC family protein [Verrucomicrobiota bacterium]